MEYLDLMEAHRKLKALREDLFHKKTPIGNGIEVRINNLSIEIREKRWI